MKRRNDGKPPRASRGMVPGNPPPARELTDYEKKAAAPSWHELVQPPEHPANKTRSLERREERGQVVRLNHEQGKPIERPKLQGGPVRLGLGHTRRHSPRAAHVVHTDAHAPKTQANKLTYCGSQHPVPADQPRTDVLRRRARRAGAA